MSTFLNPCDLTELDRPSDRQAEDWLSELESHVHIFPGDIESFLSVLVPSSGPKIHRQVSQAAFSKYNPKDLEGKDGKRRYANLLSGLRAATSSLPGDKKPKFWRHKQEEMPFPFTQFTSNHVNTFPDLSVSFPGITSNQLDWQHVALFIYVETDETVDLFGESTLDRRTLVVNLAVGARGLMAVHGHCAAFGLVIFGCWARIVRFDHSCVVASPAFSLKQDPTYLQEFFWRLFHPHFSHPIVGCDPTVRALTRDEGKWLMGSLEASHQTAPPDLATCRRVEVGTPSHADVIPKAYFTVALITLNAHLVSPATTVWRAVEDPRVPTNADDGHLSDLPDVNANITVDILKDAWRQLARRSEQDFFARIEQTIPEGERGGLPARAIDCNLGDAEVQQWRRETGKELHGANDAVRQQMLLLAPLPLQQTCTWRIIHGPDSFYRERSHVRTVTSIPVSLFLLEFRHTRELCQAIRDAIGAHKVLWENAKILHRNISVGNLFIVDGPENQCLDFAGFLYDFDYGSMVELNPSAGGQGDLGIMDERNVKERTEMDYFTAIDLLESPGIEHEVRHDLESFLWVLLWIILHHTDHTYPDGPDAPYLIFGDRGWTRGTLKRALLFSPDCLAVRNNGPLSQLISHFKMLVGRSVGYRSVVGQPMTHDEVLQIFDAVLARVDWPSANIDRPLRRRSA